MKKTLLAAALLTGFAGVASAQSSVTLYGVVDVAVRYQNWNLSKGPGSAVDVSTSSIALASGTYNTSRFGIKGVEDLGSGNQAVFVYEANLNAQNGTMSASGAPTDTLFGRQSTVGLRNDAWGQFDMGRQLGLSYKFLAPVDNAFLINTGIVNLSAVMGVTGVRYSNMLMYQSPSLSGFKVGGSYSFNTGLATLSQKSSGLAATDTATGSAFDTGNNQRAITGAVSYTNGPIYVTATYDKITPASNTIAGANGGGVSSWIVGGAYDAKVVKIGVAYSQVRGGIINGGTNSSVSGDIINPYAAGGVVFADGAGHNSYNINAVVPVGADGQVMATYQGQAAVGYLADSGFAATMSAFGLGYVHNFTKRTAIYGIYSYTNNYQNIAGLSGNTLAVGVRHAF
ncbi:MAG: porin [Alcaligenaceae bacterium]